MRNEIYPATTRQGLIVAILLPQDDINRQREDNDIPYSSQKTEESAGLSGEQAGVENLPPEQPDVDPLERETPEIDEIEENEPMDTPEIDEDETERPVPDLDEINPDTEPEIDTNYRGDDDPDNINDPIITPGTNTDLRDTPPIV